MTTIRGSIRRTLSPASAEHRLAKAQRTADAATAAAAVADGKAVVADGKAVAAQAVIDDVLVPQVVSVTRGVQTAQATNNATQAQVDGMAAAGTVSGSATNPAVDVWADGVWYEGPQVDLTDVVAGDLTITGSGPVQDSDVAVFVAPGNSAGEYRVVEIEGATETVLFTGVFTAYQNSTTPPALITNLDADDVDAFVEARTSTGAISYRMDARWTAGPAITSLSLYMFARRAA